MLTITTNVPPAEGPAQPKTYSKRCNAQRAAVATLGPEAREGFEFISFQLAGGTWGWRATEEVPPMTAQQAKVNGVTYHPPASPPADDGLDIPPGLRRENAPEQQAKVAAMVAADRDREVRMPRDSRVVANPARKPKPRPKAERLPVPPPRGAKKGAKAVKAPRPTKRASGAPGAEGGPRAGSKTAIVAGLLTRAKGCTTADILAACNWPSVSVPAMAKAAGLRLEKKKEGKTTRYWGTLGA